MQLHARPIASLLWFMFAACGGEEAATEVAVQNLGKAAIDATISDGKTPLEFKAIAPGTTSNYQVASFASLAGVVVTVGSVTSTVTLTASSGNIVNVAADGKVMGVTMVVVSGGGSQAW